ncbi:hypothetical protein [Shewanella sp. 8A]|uniref:hypothetical protein n=2 Tax=Shewanella sp. 8A TaxID=2943323 RepID=UPI00201A9A88|nr:hypothetical protein [Shewanella sp. 8A]
MDKIMIHYHGTPISGPQQDKSRFYLGRHALIPFLYQNDLPIVQECCQSFILDNSAFSHWKQGGEISVIDYAKWVQSLENHPSFDWCIIPDKIDGTEDENIALIEEWQSIGIEALSVPVFHLHESIDYLSYLIDKFRIIALGSSGEWSSPGTSSWWIRMEQIMDVLCDSAGRPKRKIHGLRMLDPNIFSHLPLSSADSANAGINAGSIKRFGMYTPPTAAQRAEVIASRIEQYNSSPLFIKNEIERNPEFNLQIQQVI